MNTKLIFKPPAVARHPSVSGTATDQLREFVKAAGLSYVRAVFRHSYFVAPDSVRRKPVWYPNVVRYSNEHHGSLKKERRGRGKWHGAEVRVQKANHYAQYAWERYTGTVLSRGSGYGVRHIWGHPWDPAAFTAGWNLCYMPHWAGMSTEDQHPDEEVQKAICQASFDLFFRSDPVCELSAYVADPGLDLAMAMKRRDAKDAFRVRWTCPRDR